MLAFVPMQMPPPDSALFALMTRFPRSGRVRWIGVRQKREQPVQALTQVLAGSGRGLEGDRYAGRNGNRGVTLIQREHLAAIAVLAGHAQVRPEQLRRNLVVEGIPLLALKGQRFRIGEVGLEGTESCDPCSRMEAALGPGGYNAMRGKGGLCARIVRGGRMQLDDEVEWMGANGH